MGINTINDVNKQNIVELNSNLNLNFIHIKIEVYLMCLTNALQWMTAVSFLNRGGCFGQLKSWLWIELQLIQYQYFIILFLIIVVVVFQAKKHSQLLNLQE